MIPFTSVAMALAPSVPMPDTVLVVCRSSQLMLHHHSDALLVVWNRVLWDWRERARFEMSRWMATLDVGSVLFLRTTLETTTLCEQLGEWHRNPFDLRYEGAIRYEVSGHLMHVERMVPHPDRLVRHHEHGRMLISRSGRSQTETARMMPSPTASSRSYQRLPALAATIVNRA